MTRILRKKISRNRVYTKQRRIVTLHACISYRLVYGCLGIELYVTVYQRDLSIMLVQPCHPSRISDVY